MPACDDNCPVRNYRTEYTIDDLRSDDGDARASYVGSTLNTPAIWTQRLRSTQIRVLRIEPGDLDTQINTSLLIATMTFRDGVELDDTKECVEYEALSYSWGYSGETVLTTCNGHQVQVLRTLYDALYHLRWEAEARYIWIDALCINQADEVEKGMQVSRMSSVFFKARSVTFYLWSGYKCSSDALRLLRDIDFAQQHSDLCEKGLKHLLLSVQLLFKAPWFRRTWVRQEVFMANELIVQTEFVRVSWSWFSENVIKLLSRGQDCLNHLKSTIDKSKSGISRHVRKDLRFTKLYTDELPSSKLDLDQNLTEILNLSNSDPSDCTTLQCQICEYTLLSTKPVCLRLLRQGSPEERGKIVFQPIHPSRLQSRGLEFVLRGSSNFHASDARDFVYGVLSMTTERIVKNPSSADTRLTAGVEEPAIKVDYSLSVNAVYEATTIYLMQTARSFDPMFFAYETRQENHAQQVGMASWCPDWSLMPEISYLDNLFQERETHFAYMRRYPNELKSMADFNEFYEARPAMHLTLLPIHLWPVLEQLKGNCRNILPCRGCVFGRLRNPGSHQTVSTPLRSTPYWNNIETTVGIESFNVPAHEDWAPAKYLSNKSVRSLSSGDAHRYFRLSVALIAVCQQNAQAPRSWLEGDVVAYLESASLLAVLRPLATENNFHLVGPLLSVPWLKRIRWFKMSDLTHDAERQFRREKSEGAAGGGKPSWLPGICTVLAGEDLPMQDILIV